jgi:peptidoglycan/LPS O-acetylase OafA/YrhL
MTSQDTNTKPAATKPAAVAPEVWRQRASNIVPMLVVLFAVLSAVALFVSDRDSGSPAPQPNYRADAPPTSQPPPPQ